LSGRLLETRCTSDNSHHINFEEVLGDLTVTTFLILMAASVVVVASMVLFPLIDLAFEKNGVQLVTVAEDTPEETPAPKQARAFSNRLSGRFRLGSGCSVVLGGF
jgi:hypothetical protein